MAVAAPAAEAQTQTTANAAPGRIPIHPALFAAFPILSIYSANLAIIPISDIWRPIIVSVSISIAATLILWPIFRSAERAAVAVSVVAITSFLYSTITAELDFLSTLWVWSLVVAVLAIWAAIKIRCTPFLNLFSLALVLVAAGNIAFGHAQIQIDKMRIVRKDGSSGLAAGGQRPDIFYFILDGYGREDALKRVMNFDNSSFIDQLQRRGFYVASRSRSNYVQTEISLSSSLNMRFIPDLVPHVDPHTSDRSPFDALISDNELSRFLRAQGYRTIAVTSGFPPIEFPNADLWLKNGSSISLFETTLLQMTPLAPASGEATSQFLWRNKTLHQAFDNVRDLATPSDRPRFVFIHILAPHPPFVLAADGSFVRPRGPFGYWDGSDYIGRCGTREDYDKGYTEQAKAINAEVLATVDALTSATRQKPIIILQGDHGSKSKLDQDSLQRTDVTECFENLEAFYVPNAIRIRLYAGITPVNEFRVILSGLFGADLPLLPDRSWYSTFPQPFNFTDVTQKAQQSRSASGAVRSASASRPAKDSA